MYSYVATYGLPFTIIRPFNNYGPFQHPEKVIPRFICQALRDLPLPVHGDGTASRDWLHVEDDCRAITAALHAPIEAVRGEVINVATGVDVSVNEIARRICDIIGKPYSLIRPVADRPGQVDRHIGSTSKAERLLGFRAQIGFDEGLERTIAWYRDNPAWWESPVRRPTDAFSS